MPSENAEQYNQWVQKMTGFLKIHLMELKTSQLVATDDYMGLEDPDIEHIVDVFQALQRRLKNSITNHGDTDIIRTILDCHQVIHVFLENEWPENMTLFSIKLPDVRHGKRLNQSLLTTNSGRPFFNPFSHAMLTKYHRFLTHLLTDGSLRG